MMRRAGLSLLEVVLALAILAMSMVAIGQLMTLGAKQALTIEDQRRGQQYAQSLLDSVAVGALPMQSVGWTSIETDPDWEYSLAVEDNSVPGLKAVTGVTQRRDQISSPRSGVGVGNDGVKPSTVQLTRWIVDPLFVQDRVITTYLIDQEIVEAMIEAEAATEAEGGAAGGAADGGGAGR